MSAGEVSPGQARAKDAEEKEKRQPEEVLVEGYAMTYKKRLNSFEKARFAHFAKYCLDVVGGIER